MVFQHVDDVLSKEIFDLSMARDRLAGSRLGTLMPIVPFTGADEDATSFSIWRIRSRRFMRAEALQLSVHWGMESSLPFFAGYSRPSQDSPQQI